MFNCPEVLLGPNAMVACKKEGYARSDFAFRDFCDLLRFRSQFYGLFTLNHFFKLPSHEVLF